MAKPERPPQRLTGANTLMGVADGRFDGHAHVFRADLPLAARRRYAPSYDATAETFAALLDAAGLDGALLVQPSFLGADNSFLLRTLAEAETLGKTFRGVVGLTPETPVAAMREMAAAGVVGVRLNLLGTPWSAADAEAWDGVLRAADGLGWHVELHCEGARLATLLPGLFAVCKRVVVDHFGRPTPDAPESESGVAALMAAPRERLFVKTSAPYRVFPGLSDADAARRCAPLFRRLLDRLGPERLLWGSDWPWTQHEATEHGDSRRYADAVAWERLWLESAAAGATAGRTPRREAG